MHWAQRNLMNVDTRVPRNCAVEGRFQEAVALIDEPPAPVLCLQVSEQTHGCVSLIFP
jgi:hypothetical protein